MERNGVSNSVKKIFADRVGFHWFIEKTTGYSMGNITRMSSLWGYFEESAIQEESDICLELQTQTRQREEPDQRAIAQSTSTFTATREEPDQDTNNSFYRAIPSTKILFTKTLTEQREENDQDSGHFEYATFPFE